jgi:Carboxypeptidase regulatory-like domain
MKKLFVFTLTLQIINGVAAYAQESYAALLGKVSDQTGAAISGAKIIVTSNETGLSRTGATDGNGDYRVSLLSAGRYSLRTAAQRSGMLNYNTFTDTNGNGQFDAGEPTAPATLNLAGRIAPISRAVLDGFIPLPNADIAGANYIANGIQKMDEDVNHPNFTLPVSSCSNDTFGRYVSNSTAPRVV